MTNPLGMVTPTDALRADSPGNSGLSTITGKVWTWVLSVPKDLGPMLLRQVAAPKGKMQKRSTPTQHQGKLVHVCTSPVSTLFSLVGYSPLTSAKDMDIEEINSRDSEHISAGSNVDSETCRVKTGPGVEWIVITLGGISSCPTQETERAERIPN